MVGGSQCEETVWQVWLSGLGLASARHAHTYLGAQQVFSTSVKLGVLQVNSSLDVKSTQPALESECRRAPCLVATVFEKKKHCILGIHAVGPLSDLQMKYIWGIGINKEIILNIAAETHF